MPKRTPDQYNWATALFNDRRLSKHFTSPRRGKIKHVTLHHSTIVGTGNGAALETMFNVWQTRQASANYGIDGKHVWQYVSDNDAAWANATSSNHETLSIEHTNSTGAPTWKISDETMATGARLVATLHRLYGLGRPSRKTVKMHRDYYATACPGPYLTPRLNEYIAEAARIYDGTTKPVTPKPVTPKPAPTPVIDTPAPTVLHGLHWNVAGSDTVNGYQAENATRGPAVGAWAKSIGFDVLVACEAGQHNLRAGISKGIGITSWCKHSKAIWATPAVKVTARKSYADSTYNYLRSVKYGAGIFGTKAGKQFAVLEIHTDYRKPAKQAQQVQSLFRKFVKDADQLGIPRENLVVAGDFNWDGTSADNPFRALTDWGFHEKGSTTDATFLDGRHLDGILAHRNAKVDVRRPDRANAKGVRLSDHFPREFDIELR